MAANAEVLFAEYHDRLYRYFCRAAGSPETARDLTQDVFLRVTRSAIPEASGLELRAWLFRIARNLAIDHNRQRQRRPEGALASATDASHGSSQDVSAAINEALARLSDLDRDVFLMREVAGLAYDEIATACDLTAPAVRSRLHRTRLALRDMLAAPIASTRTRPLRWADRRHS